MPRSTMYDPGTMEARVQWLAGLTEICNKLSGVLNMKTATFEDLTLPEVYISEEDRFRIYQAPLGNKLWLQTPAPVIKRNGVIITPEFDGFEIDYLGGSIAFNEEYTLTENDIVTASATYIIDTSNTINSINAQITSLIEKTAGYKGSFETLDSLKSAFDIGSPGDYAIVQDENTIYVWSKTDNEWVDVHKGVDLSDYFNKTQVKGLLDLKENNISAKGNTADADLYYYGGRKTWVGLADKILGVALTGLSTTNNIPISATDTFLTAFGKLQAQINANIHPMSGTNDPTTSTVGKIGQDYINTSNGDKYHLTQIIDADTESPQYLWEQYSDVSSMKEYVDSSIQSAVLSAWKKNY